jgi:murein hydrolase activator
MKIIIAIFIFFITFQINSFGQSKDELEQQRQETNQIIENTTRLLEQTSLTRRNSIERLNIVRRRLQLRQNLIRTIQAEIDYLDNAIVQRQIRISDLENDLTVARNSYAQLIRIAYKQRFMHQRIMFILSADDFNQAYRRLKYLQQYGQSRQKQIALIETVTREIIDELEGIELERSEKVTLLAKQQNETELLNIERREQNAIVQDLSKRESQLKEELRKQEEVAIALQNAIEELLREEAKLAAERRMYELTPEEKIVSDDFRNNMGGLPWPTERGVVTGFFGERPHPVLRGIMIQNNGIDISTEENAEVRALFTGIVRQVIMVPGSNNVILIRHGNFLSVYSNLAHVYVRGGDKVDTKQLIGRVFTDTENSESTILHLEIWEENRKLDPMIWLSRQ